MSGLKPEAAGTTRCCPVASTYDTSRSHRHHQRHPAGPQRGASGDACRGRANLGAIPGRSLTHRRGPRRHRAGAGGLQGGPHIFEQPSPRHDRRVPRQAAGLLAQGEAKFGTRVADRKRDLVYDTIDYYLAKFPTKRRDRAIDLYTHAVTGTPFVVIYDFDDTELRVFFIVHGHTDRAHIDPADVEW